MAANAVLGTPAECLVRVDQEEIKFNISLVRLDQFIDAHHRLMVRIQQVGTKESTKDIDDPGQFTRFLGSGVTLSIKPKGESSTNRAPSSSSA